MSAALRLIKTKAAPDDAIVPAIDVQKHGFQCRVCRHVADVVVGDYRCDLCGEINAMFPLKKEERKAIDRDDEVVRGRMPDRAAPDPVDRLDDLGRARTLRRLRRERKFTDTDIADMYDPAREPDMMDLEPGGDPNGDLWDPETPIEVPDLDATPARQVTADRSPRLHLLPSLDELLDKRKKRGAKRGKVIVVSGDPGVGKSSLLQQTAATIARREKALVVYSSAEEPSEDVRDNLERFGLWVPAVTKHLEIAGNELEHGQNIDALCKYIREKQPIFAVADSLQEYETLQPYVSGAAGERSQVIYVARALVDACGESGTTLLLVGHLTKNNQAAGPKLVEHKVHATMRMESGRFERNDKTGRVDWKRLEEPPEDGSLWYVRAYMKKNRGGPKSSCFFEMTDGGLVDVALPDAVALAEESSDARRALTDLLKSDRRTPAVDAPGAARSGRGKPVRGEFKRRVHVDKPTGKRKPKRR